MQNPVVTIQMSSGEILKAELLPEIAPNTVRNFIALIRNKFYDGLIFHRCIPGVLLQGGDPSGTGLYGPGYCIRGEFSANDFDNYLSHRKGVLSMARTNDPDSAGSQFFICLRDLTELDGEYAAFGVLTDGLDAAVALSDRPVDYNEKPKDPIRIETMSVETYGVEYPLPDILKCDNRPPQL